MKKESRKANKNLMTEIFNFTAEYRPFVYLSIILSIISSLLALVPYIAFYFIIRQVIFNIAEPVFAGQRLDFGLIALLAAILSIGLYTLALVLSHLAAFRASKNMKKTALKHVVTLPMGYFALYRPSKIRQQIDDNTNAIEVFISHQLPDLAGAFSLPIAVLLILFFFDWRLGIASLVPVFLAFIMVSSGLTEEQKQIVIDFENQKEEIASSALEYVRGMPVVKVFQQTVFTFRNFYNDIVSYRKIAYELCEGFKRGTSLYNLLINSIYIFLLLAGLFLYQRSAQPAIFIVDLIFYLMLVAIFPNMLSKIMKLSDDLMKLKTAQENFDNLMDVRSLDKASNPKKPEEFGLSFENVSFSYPGSDKEAICNLSFECKQGKTLALVGPSGGGKTTIAKLLARFYDISQGAIRIGGVDIRDMAKEDLMNTVSFVFQDTRLMEGTIADNIARGCGNVSSDEIYQAALRAQCQDIIDKLPDGLDTLYGSQGVYLSGGESQRIAIANSILRNTPIVVLDEATAYADPENEYLIQKSLEELTRDKTLVVIAHRLTSLETIPKILVVDQGRLVEEGSHLDLLNLNGTYRAMWEDFQTSLDWQI